MEEIEMLRQEAEEYGKRKTLEALVNIERERIRHDDAMESLNREYHRLLGLPPDKVLEMYIREYR
jgi:hypothetical protein